MERAIALSEYQFVARLKHRPAQGMNHQAIVEDAVRSTLQASPKHRLLRSDLYKRSGAKKFGLILFDRVIDTMHKEGMISRWDKSKDKVKGRGRRGEVIVLGDGEQELVA